MFSRLFKQSQNEYSINNSLLPSVFSISCAHKTFSKNSGFSFIEVMVAAFIFSTAILPLISLSISNLQTTSKINQQEAVLTAFNNLSTNISINQEYLAKSKLDVAYFDQNKYQLTRLGSCNRDLYQCFCISIPSAIPDCRSSDCSSDELAIYDIHQFSCLIARASDSFQIKLEDNGNNRDVVVSLGKEEGLEQRLTLNIGA